MADSKNVNKERKKEILIEREKFWQNTLDTFIPHGLKKT